MEEKYPCFQRTEERGDFPAEAVYVLPCLTKPPSDILALFSLDVSEHTRRLYPSQLNGGDPLEKPHTLEVETLFKCNGLFFDT